ncbi:MAG: N-acetylmuramoyl-L-alanine amidase [Bacteroidota bacterium]|nr:N-acetylmuramoyl-L-alanine amidase [uncultured Allomuricauda sp.]
MRTKAFIAHFSLLIIMNLGYGQEKKILVLDPGHGGIDSGAMATGHLYEKDIVLDIAFKMQYWNRELLSEYFDIYLTRSIDTLISLNHRTKLARHLKPDLFVSLHCNHAQNKKATGIEVYTFLKTESANNFQSKSEVLAEVISEGIANNLGFANRGGKTANFQVLRETKNICPAVLVEMGFLSNMDESNYLKLNEKREALALTILLSLFDSTSLEFGPQ